MGLIAAIAFWMPNCSPHSLHETISVFGRWATSLWLSFTATGHRFSPGLNVFLYSSGISSINLPESWYSRNLAEAKSCEVGLSVIGFWPLRDSHHLLGLVNSRRERISPANPVPHRLLAFRDRRIVP